VSILQKSPSDSVLEVLRRRREQGSRPGERRRGDTARLAVLVEGGGMRGVISAAMLTALEDLGFKNAIDGVYGCSAGAMNAAYFLSSVETWYYLSIYFDNLSNREFVDFVRVLRGRDIMNLEYAFDEVVSHHKPLDFQAVLQSAIPLTIVLTMADTATAERVSTFVSVGDLREALIAACWLPIARRGSAWFRGRSALDGGILTPDLTVPAREDGFTHFLYLRTQPETGQVRGSKLFRRGMARYFERLAPGLGYAYRRSWSVQANASSRIPGSILQVRPHVGGQRLTRHEISSAKLLQAARTAYTRTVEILEGPKAQAFDVVPRFVVHRAQALTAPSRATP
jgi:predicted patatin/cPLA2 family phospholipase